MRFDILTLFPAVFDGFVGESILAKAAQAGLIEIHRHQLRDWSWDEKHHKVDDRPFGGGPGMLLQPGPVVDAVEAIEQANSLPAQRILLTPQGDRLRQFRVEQLAQLPRLLLICGRYEGFDQRIIDILQPEQLSVGDYILNGGEVAAMAVVEAVSRLIPGVLGDPKSHQEDSFSGDRRRIEFPQYTRPRVFRGHGVPDVLVSGNHEQVAKWRAEQSRPID